MKKILSFALALALVLTSMASAFAADITASRFEVRNADGEIIDVIPQSGAVKTAVTVENFGENEVIELISVSYDNNENIVNVARKTIAAKKARVFLETELPAEGASVIRHFVWTKEGITPITTKKELTHTAPPAAETEEFGIYVNGRLLPGFEEGKYEYTVDMSDSTVMPVVTVTGADNAVITNPTEFPGFSKVEIDDETYIITYTAQASNPVTDFEILIPADDRRNGSAGGADRNDVDGVPTADATEVVQGMTVGNPIYRVHPWQSSQITEVNEKYADYTWIKTDMSFNYAYYGALHQGDTREWFSFKVTKPVRVYLAECYAEGSDERMLINANNAWLSDWTISDTSLTGVIVKGTASWHLTAGYGTFEFGGMRSVYKDFSAGETVTLYTMGNGRFPYLPVIEPIYESPVTVTIDGKPLNGFNENVYEYNYTIDGVNQKKTPVVQVTDAGKRDITITKPTSFPGKTVITIGDKTYNINYVPTSYVTDFNILIDAEDRRNGNASGDERNDAAGTPTADGSALVSGMKTGDSFCKMYAAFKSSIVETNPEYANLMWVKTDGSFAYPYYGQKHQATDNEWVSFKLSRPARVYIAEAYAKGSTNATLKISNSSTWLNDWTITDTPTTGIFAKATTTYHTSYGDIEYGSCRTIYKDFNAGDTVTLYTMGNGNLPYIALIQPEYEDILSVSVEVHDDMVYQSAKKKYYPLAYNNVTAIFNDRPYAIENVWDYLDLEDAYYIYSGMDVRDSDAWKAITDSVKTPWYTITVNETCDIMIFSQNMDAPYGIEDYTVNNRNDNAPFFTSPIGAGADFNKLYTKRVEVADGETETVTFYNLDSESSASHYREAPYVVFVKPVK